MLTPTRFVFFLCTFPLHYLFTLPRHLHKEFYNIGRTVFLSSDSYSVAILCFSNGVLIIISVRWALRKTRCVYNTATGPMAARYLSRGTLCTRFAQSSDIYSALLSAMLFNSTGYSS